ncbi:LOW QUALITY PROTEIN: hypothetical protein HID58_018538, partial [Brassica napus]
LDQLTSPKRSLTESSSRGLVSTRPSTQLRQGLTMSPRRFMSGDCSLICSLAILKLSYLLTNRAILEAMEGEKMVLCEPDQWLALIQAYNSRPEGPPHLRITGVHHHKEVLDQMAHRLIEEAEKLYIPFQFRHQLRVKTGEALAVSSGLSPNIMVVTEQDSDHNGSTLMERLLESLYTYAALFDCLENKIPRTSQDRIKVEKMQFGEEIKNIIACEGSERRERHEKLENRARGLIWLARRLLQGYGFDGYMIKEESGCAVICWQGRPLYSVSAWRCRKFDPDYTKTGRFKFFSHDLKTQNCCKKCSGLLFGQKLFEGRVSWSSSYGLGARYKVIPCLKLRISLGEALKNKSPELSSKAAVDK